MKCMNEWNVWNVWHVRNVWNGVRPSRFEKQRPLCITMCHSPESHTFSRSDQVGNALHKSFRIKDILQSKFGRFRKPNEVVRKPLMALIALIALIVCHLPVLCAAAYPFTKLNQKTPRLQHSTVPQSLLPRIRTHAKNYKELWDSKEPPVMGLNFWYMSERSSRLLPQTWSGKPCRKLDLESTSVSNLLSKAFGQGELFLQACLHHHW